MKLLCFGPFRTFDLSVIYRLREVVVVDAGGVSAALALVNVIKAY